RPLEPPLGLGPAPAGELERLAVERRHVRSLARGLEEEPPLEQHRDAGRIVPVAHEVARIEPRPERGPRQVLGAPLGLARRAVGLGVLGLLLLFLFLGVLLLWLDAHRARAREPDALERG